MNPVLEIAKHIVFHENTVFTIDRPAKFGGSITFENYDQLEKTYIQGGLHPMDLKTGVGESIATILEPVRNFFETDKEANLCANVVREAKVTR